MERLNERISNMDMYFEDEKAKILKYIDDRGEELARLLYKFKVSACATCYMFYLFSIASRLSRRRFNILFRCCFETNRKNSMRTARCDWIGRRWLWSSSRTMNKKSTSVSKTKLCVYSHHDSIVLLTWDDSKPTSTYILWKEALNLVLIHPLLPLLQESREARYSAVREILEDNVRLRDKTEARFQAFFDKELNRLKNDFRSEAEVKITWNKYCYCCISAFFDTRRMPETRYLWFLFTFCLLFHLFFV